MNLKGFVVAEVRKNGLLLARRAGPNIVTVVGKNLITSVLSSNSGASPAALQFGRAFAIGSGTNPSTEADTALQTEITRAAYTSKSAVGNLLTYNGSFTNAGGTWTVEEAGLLDALASGNLIARWLSQGLSVPNAAVLNLSWSLTIG
jgi:hypothetical protein